MLPRGARAGTKRRADYRPPAFVVDELALEFDLDPDATTVTATYGFRRNSAAARIDAHARLVLDGEHQHHVRIMLDGAPVADDRLLITSSQVTLRDTPDAGTLSVRSVIAPSRNVALEGLYVSSGVFCTQCEPEGFRRITCFPDRPDVLARYDVTLRADRARYPQLLSNGNLIESGPLDDGRHYARWRDPFPKPTYLFALVAGDLAVLDDTFLTASGRHVALRIFATHANIGRCRHAMESLRRAMRWDEVSYGREYDLDTFMIFCADDFNLGAMENKGLNIFNSRLLLADPATATDDDFSAVEAVIAHEYFHNWTGNRVTCRDWFQLSLKEGLTVFRDQEFSSDHGSRAVERIAAVEYLRREQFAEDAGPMAHPVRPDEYEEINNFYTATVYEKGAELIRMQHALLGSDRFRKGMDLYFERHDGQAVTCEDFVRSMQDASGVDLAQFRHWYAQAGTPVVTVRGSYDAPAQTYTLDVEQALPSRAGSRRRPPLHLPLALGLVGPDGADVPLRLAGEEPSAATTRVLEITANAQRFEFVDVAKAPVPSLLRGFSAPVRVVFDYDDESLALLASHDSDPVNRWDAMQRLYVSGILGLARAHRAGTPLGLPPVLTRAVVHLLCDRTGDPSLLALALALPDAAYIAALEQRIDPDAIVAAIVYVERTLATSLRDEFVAAYRHFRPRGAYVWDPTQTGLRSMSNRCLRYLGALDDAATDTLVTEQFDSSDNMTDSIGALAALRDARSSVRDALYTRFEARWSDDALVLDKWFELQAQSMRDDTLDVVRALLAHPRFNLRNPNRVRSLVGAFTLRNFARFHARDGKGYAFAAEQVRALDAINPQLAAAVAGAFNLWRRFEEPRRTQMLESLEHIARGRALSPDVTEVVTRLLAL